MKEKRKKKKDQSPHKRQHPKAQNKMHNAQWGVKAAMEFCPSSLLLLLQQK